MNKMSARKIWKQHQYMEKNNVRQSVFAAHVVMNEHGTNESDHSVRII